MRQAQIGVVVRTIPNVTFQTIVLRRRNGTDIVTNLSVIRAHQARQSQKRLNQDRLELVVMS